MYYVVLGIKGDTIAYEQRYEQRNLDVTLLNDAYERVVVIVAGLDNLGNYRHRPQRHAAGAAHPQPDDGQ